MTQLTATSGSQRFLRSGLFGLYDSPNAGRTVYAVGNGVSAPIPIRNVQPSYTLKHATRMPREPSSWRRLLERMVPYQKSRSSVCRLWSRRECCKGAVGVAFQAGYEGRKPVNVRFRSR
jgi:hypothetical protein